MTENRSRGIKNAKKASKTRRKENKTVEQKQKERTKEGDKNVKYFYFCKVNTLINVQEENGKNGNKL